ncbi:MAG: hypothetical protein KKH28_12625 [Elusimicrobia bacterium]|nr:hypothetical protein [Elusimicrobiota bacterium]
MDDKASGLLEQLAVLSLEKCLARLSKVSAGTWRMESAGVSRETLEDAVKRHGFRNSKAAAVYFNVTGEFPFVALMLFEPDDIELVSKCFLAIGLKRLVDPFPKAPGITQPQEMMLLELGNIILNSFVSAVSEGLKKIIMPSVPQYIQGDAQRLVGELGTIADLKQNFRIITLALDIQCGKDVSKSTVFGIIPEKLANELERRYNSGNQ